MVTLENMCKIASMLRMDLKVKLYSSKRSSHHHNFMAVADLGSKNFGHICATTFKLNLYIECQKFKPKPDFIISVISVI